MYAYIYIEKSLWNKCKYYKVSDGKSFTLMWFCGFIYYIACKGGWRWRGTDGEKT